MEQSRSWEANRFSASQEILRILWNPKVQYPILSQLDPVHTATFHCLKININIVLSSTPGSPKWSLSFRLPTKTLYKPLLSLSVLYEIQTKC